LGQRSYIPLEQLMALGRQQLQEHPEIRSLYTQAAGMTHFLMDFENGRYRPALLTYLRSVYESRDLPGVLNIADTAPGSSADQYLEFLNVTDAMLASVTANWPLTKLCLCRTSVSDRGLALLSGQSALSWLDLSHTTITDGGMQMLRVARDLDQLNLEGTGVSDATLELIAQLRGLEELDLSGTAITDQGLSHLAGLENLRGLWLTGTRVTDEGLHHLYQLKRLKTLEVTGTGVTPAGWQAVVDALPSLADTAATDEDHDHVDNP
jgi:hypothetical protein